MIQIAAVVYVAMIVGVVAFQICLIAGAPWGRLTQGGGHAGALPARGRVAAGVSILLLLALAAGVASAAGLPPGWPAWTGWTALGIQAVSTVLNWITPSPAERRLWGPVTAAMLALAALVVIGSR